MALPYRLSPYIRRRPSKRAKGVHGSRTDAKVGHLTGNVRTSLNFKDRTCGEWQTSAAQEFNETKGCVSSLPQQLVGTHYSREDRPTQQGHVLLQKQHTHHRKRWERGIEDRPVETTVQCNRHMIPPEKGYRIKRRTHDSNVNISRSSDVSTSTTMMLQLGRRRRPAILEIGTWPHARHRVSYLIR